MFGSSSFIATYHVFSNTIALLNSSDLKFRNQKNPIRNRTKQKEQKVRIEYVVEGLFKTTPSALYIIYVLTVRITMGRNPKG